MAGYIKKEPVRLGLVATLSGTHAELGVQIRNGAQLAVEKINETGGIAVRPVELVICDDLGTREGALAADEKLITAGVAAIIGHSTSAQTLTGLTITGPAHIIMLGPSISSPIFTGKSEYFFRVHPSFLDGMQGFAQHIYNRQLTKIAILYDMNNAAYTETYRTAFTDKYQQLGGTIAGEAAFSSTVKPDFNPLLVKLHEKNADALLIIAADIDTAMIAQHARLMGWKIPLFAAAWAQTETLIYHGGQAVEGMEIEQAYTLTSQDPDYLDFKQRYQDRFGRFPSFGAAYGYEATMVLAAALHKTGGKTKGLRQALLEIRDFKGLTNNFSFNQYGDVVRPIYLNVIRNGKFTYLDTLTQGQ
ncbi:Leucine-, isoleucine-, valine-, threonine-, and alanine-binding protein [Sporomusa acidovorans DSM 3132]|uniref:Leucine-, isoleucine-, valine-, threonine-, and alanine-binding protein n=1 Tax=Sporomusa acidovorans (strain ATCC 49682 / DSM 3132 / Mol) TaxID=1123286 RepID=A0ABZ3JAA4_SPOA4|nr:ABC transporter substrate-binding protein [Sporomusa acidovorans]OZC13328.1 leucine-, isoleucine-, valine-, threonine-, and alanine-binding protein precursor [Sporomusa acidovorans DSM 3132]SDD96443.1 amino acid/amide ABC transporter substrate-binding protein, HAAT family [Sporomusa acidovorans]